MATRADYYVLDGPKNPGSVVWHGSVAHNGAPGASDNEQIVQATTRLEYEAMVHAVIARREDATKPAQGWPWPWEDSRTTDWSYWYDTNTQVVYASHFGRGWWPATTPNLTALIEAEPQGWADHKHGWFPDMTDRANAAVPGSERSGLIVLEVPLSQPHHSHKPPHHSPPHHKPTA